MADLRPILLVEDNLKDIELTLAALAECQLADNIIFFRPMAPKRSITCSAANNTRIACPATPRSYCWI